MAKRSQPGWRSPRGLRGPAGRAKVAPRLMPPPSPARRRARLSTSSRGPSATIRPPSITTMRSTSGSRLCLWVTITSPSRYAAASAAQFEHVRLSSTDPSPRSARRAAAPSAWRAEPAPATAWRCAARQRIAALADRPVEALRMRRRDRRHAGRARDHDEVGVARVRRGDAQVLAQRAVEQPRILADQRDAGAHVGRLDRGEIDAVEQHLPAGRTIEAGDQAAAASTCPTPSARGSRRARPGGRAGRRRRGPAAHRPHSRT